MKSYRKIVENGITVHQIGCFDLPDAMKTRIVHISDTHKKHNAFIPIIPAGDVVIHSGDFGHFSLKRLFTKTSDLRKQTQEISSFFSSLPHPHKIFVAGNHELSFDSFSAFDIQQRLEPVIYLQDALCVINGIQIYGLPWNLKRFKSPARGFSCSHSKLLAQWRQIPPETDIIASHSHSFGALDFIIRNDIAPLAHLHGHIHPGYSVQFMHNVLTSNAAMKSYECNREYLSSPPQRTPHVIDVFKQKESAYIDCVKPIYLPPDSSTLFCASL